VEAIETVEALRPDRLLVGVTYIELALLTRPEVLRGVGAIVLLIWERNLAVLYPRIAPGISPWIYPNAAPANPATVSETIIKKIRNVLFPTAVSRHL
jgi:hypothetical protein